MSDTATVRVNVTRRVSASAERVYDAWLDSDTAGMWLFATDTGQMVKAEIDPRVGGKFCFTDRRGGEEIDHVGEYVELDRPRRIVFTFAVPKYSAQYTTVTIDIVPDGDDCDVALTHDGVLADYERRTIDGWTTILGRLARVVG